jgi:iron-sulfur cluster assembly protein
VLVETETPTVEVTPRAAEKAIQLATRDGFETPYLRLRVTAGGCSGFSYNLSFEREPGADDHVIRAYGLGVLIDARSMPIVAGSTIEFIDAMLGGGFKVQNPQAVHECACGDSFAI